VAVRKDSPNFGEVIQAAGYRTMMVGKWHCDGVPFERGFDRHFGFMRGGTNYFLGDDSFTLDGKPWEVPNEDFYVTTALTDYAVRFIREEHETHPDHPFFLYLAYNAPHSPIQARPEDVAKYRGKYLKGWDVIRRERFEKQQALGLAGPGWHLPERPENIPAWDTLNDKEKDFEDLRMATYAAMVDCVDQGVGEVIGTLDDLGIRDNTFILFLNDNGASPNDRVRRGAFGSPNSTWNTGVAWAFVSNTPLKYYKRTQHSGGVTTPCIANWPAVIKSRKEYEDQPCHVTDILPTLMDIAGTSYPAQFGGKGQPPLPGRSFAPILRTGELLPSRTLHFSLFNNMAIVDDGWRLVTAYSQPWQLYDLTNDRSETHNVASERPEKLREMLALQRAFVERPDVRLRFRSGEREPEYAPIYKADGVIGPGSRENVPDERLSLLLAKARAEGRQLNDADLETLRRQAVGKKK
jgi:arylsulfatase